MMLSQNFAEFKHWFGILATNARLRREVKKCIWIIA